MVSQISTFRVFEGRVFVEELWRAVVPDAGTNFCEFSTNPEKQIVDACETCC